MLARRRITRFILAGGGKAKDGEAFTDVVIKAINAKSERVVLILWGGDVKRKKKLIDLARHAVL